ncbi:MAG: DUF4838 domain-containing protein [Victivallales bacterium]|nr:DUF4838 domain-containing protein [Victivallales bacterium]
MKKKMLWMFLVLLTAGVCHAGQFKVVSDGKAVCPIVVADDANHVVRLAAEELKKWIGEITDAPLEIVGNADGACIELVVSEEVPELKGNDGYAIRTSGERFRIIGSCPKGVLNGVYKVLYRNTDIIWARPEPEIGTVFSKKVDIVFKEDNMVDVPVYKQRGHQMVCGGKDLEINNLWQVRNGSNWISAGDKEVERFGCIREFGGGHNLCRVFLPEKMYYKDHADFYPFIDGKRINPLDYKYRTQLCFTNPEMTKEFIRRLDDIVQKHIDYTVFRVIIEDNYILCCCPKCMEPITLPNGEVLDGRNLAVESQEWKVWRSTQFFLWLNQLAAYMKEKYPDKRLLTLAYFFTEFAPKTEIPDNVDISFAPIYRDSKHYIDAPKNKVVMDTIDEWLSKTKNITLREYYGESSEFPRPTDRVAFHDYALLAKRGMTKTYSTMFFDADKIYAKRTGTKVWDVGAPFLWTLAQASWNPYRNVEEVRREFYVRVFGAAAAPEVEAIYAAFERGWYSSPARSGWNDDKKKLWKNCYLKPGIDIEVNERLEKALALVGNPKGKAMLERLKASLVNEFPPVPAAAPMVIPKAKSTVPFEPDGMAAAWKDAFTMTEFFDETGQPTTYPTVMKFIHDGENLYALLHAERKNLYKMLDPKTTYCQAEAFNVFVQMDDERFPDYFHVIVDPLGRIFASASENRPVPEFKFRYKSSYERDRWDCIVAFPLSQLPKTKRIAAFRRLIKSEEAGKWPSNGPGFKNAVLHELDTYAPFTLGN